MKRRPPTTARGRAVEALRRVLERGERASATVTTLARGLSPPDQDLLRELVLGVLRWKSALDDELSGMCRVPLPKLAPNLREILEVALYQARRLDRIPAYAAVSEAVDAARASGGEGAARLVNGVLRGVLLLPAPAPPAAADAAALARFYSHPVFLVERWLARFGAERTRAILEADNAPPRLDLLVNPRRGNRDALREALAREGVSTEASPIAPLALTVLSGNPLRTRAFAEGRFGVQDVGSQILPLLLPEGDLLVDLAAAPGGKSFSAVAHGRARRTLALDRSWGRLLRVAESARRLGVTEVRRAAADFAAPPLPGAAFDRVVLDAPCSGTGTLRKNPEIRYRVTASAIDRIAQEQGAALLSAAELLAPGGDLLYATCSLEEEENEAVVAAVLSRAPGLEPKPIDPPPGLEAAVDGARLRLFPDDRCDGFTAHRLRRRAG